MVTLGCVYTHPDFEGTFKFEGKGFDHGVIWWFIHTHPDGFANRCFFSAEKDVENMELVDDSFFRYAFGAGTPIDRPYANGSD